MAKVYRGFVPGRALMTIVVMAVLVAGCSDGDDDAEDVTAGAQCENDGDAGPYFLFHHSDWQFKEAIDYPEDGGIERVEPSLDWYAEYERLTPSTDGLSVEGFSLRLSGHDAALDDHQDELRSFDPTEREVDGTRALVGTGPGGSPTVVTIAVADDYTLMLLSYGLELEELADTASAVERVCQPAWVEAGGRVLECVPTEPGCDEARSRPPASTTSLPATSTTTTATAPTTSSGVSGRVTAGPTCPVERADQPCPPRPVQGRVQATDAGGQVVGSVDTDAEGRYTMRLAPGDYTLRIVTEGRFPACPETPVTITSGPPVTADIECDTGIR